VDGRSFGLLSCDLDGFKALNDRMGFSEGDQLLRATAEMIQGQPRISDGPDGFTGTPRRR
jgi:diguanylate cyclase (GGDEF)-like protein